MKNKLHSYSEFGKRVKITMIQLGLTSKELARLMGCTESTVCDILKGRNRSEERKQTILELLEDWETKNHS